MASKAGKFGEIKYAYEAALCELAPPEDFQHEWIFSKGLFRNKEKQSRNWQVFFFHL